MSQSENPQQMQQTPGRGLFYGYIVVISAFVLLVMGWGLFYVYGVFFNPLSQDFSWNRATTAGAFSISILVAGVFGIIAGRLSDRFGPKIVLVFCTVILAMGYILMSLIQELWQFYLIYGGLIAMGLAGYWAPPMSAVSRWFVKRRGLMTGIVSGGISFATLVLPPLVAHLVTTFDWRVAYVIIGAAVLIIDLVILRFFRSSPQEMGLTPLGAPVRTVPQFFGGFSIAQTVKTRQFWMICIMYLCFGLFQMAVTVHIVPYAQDINISAIKAAGILSILGGVSLASRIIMGVLVDRIKVRITTILSLIILAAAMVWLQFADSLWKLYLFAGILGFGYGGLSCLQALIAAELFGLISMGVITAFFSFSFNIGGAIGPVMAGYLFDAGGSYHLAFFICALVAVMALIFSVSIHPPRQPNSDKP